MSKSPPLRIAYLYVSDWAHEFAAYDRGDVPSHRLFGAAELRELGDDVLVAPSATRRWRGRSAPWQWHLHQLGWLLWHQRRVDAVVATHEVAAFGALVARRLGLLQRPVVVLSVALPFYLANKDRRGAWRFALRGADLVTVYARAQAADVAAAAGLGEDRVQFLAFGVDERFFAATTARRDGTLLAVGTNEGKDYPTLVRALSKDVSLTIVTDPANAELARAAQAPGQQVQVLSHVPIRELRELYARCQRVVIPLRDSAYSSGQTVLLECLMSNTPVIVTDVPAVRDYATGLAQLVPPGDSAALAQLLDQPASARETRSVAQDRFSARQMARALRAELQRLAR